MIMVRVLLPQVTMTMMIRWMLISINHKMTQIKRLWESVSKYTIKKINHFRNMSKIRRILSLLLSFLAPKWVQLPSYLLQVKKNSNKYSLRKSKFPLILTCTDEIWINRSQKVKCPHCDAVSYSIVAYETNLLGYLLAVLGILVFGLLSMLMMPFLVGLTK